MKFKRQDEVPQKLKWQYTDKELIQAIRDAKGFLAVAAKRLGITYQAIWNRQKRVKKIKKIIKMTREEHLDFTEHKLLQNIAKGKEQSIFFHLECLGKERGYVKRQELSGVKGQPIQMTVEHRLAQIHKEREIAMKGALERGEYVGDRNVLDIQEEESLREIPGDNGNGHKN